MPVCKHSMLLCFLVLVLALASVSAFAQKTDAPDAYGTQPAPAQDTQTSSSQDPYGQNQSQPADQRQSLPGRSEGGFPIAGSAIYPGDLLDITTFGVPELTTRTRVSREGDIYLPLIGYVTVGGMQSPEAQKAIEQKLIDGKFLNSPHVLVSVLDTMGVTILGEVARPGVYPLTQARRLTDLVSVAGGFTQTASRQMTIAHREKGESQTFKFDAKNSNATNMDLLPGDTVTVAKAGIVYVVGEVNAPAGLAMDQDEQLSLLHAIALVKGPARGAALDKSTILRKEANGKIQTIPVPLKKILHAKADDMTLLPGDVLYVPSGSSMKGAFRRGAETALGVTGQLAVVAVH